MKIIITRIFIPALFAASVSAGAADDPPQRPQYEHACLKSSAWMILDGSRLAAASEAEVLAKMSKRDVVLLGEIHDDEDHHRWQVQTLAVLHAMRPNMIIGFEMFPRRAQPVLDRWVAGELTVKQFLEQSEWEKIWNVPAELYLPLFQFARLNRIPMLALNVDRKFVKAIVEKGWDAVPEHEREGVGRAAPPSGAYRDSLSAIRREHGNGHGAAGVKTEQDEDRAFRNFVESQTTWDRAMAEALAHAVRSRPVAERPLAVGIMGGGHIRFGFGVQHQLSDLGLKEVGSLLPLPSDFDCRNIGVGLADAIFSVPKHISSRESP